MTDARRHAYIFLGSCRENLDLELATRAQEIASAVSRECASPMYRVLIFNNTGGESALAR
jgi:hypothetical protein